MLATVTFITVKTVIIIKSPISYREEEKKKPKHLIKHKENDPVFQLFIAM